uniref:Uncharacterized protein n=1 Tax=Globodera rostochiensis TaxID=31243 RepID=A0A914H7Z0_GLORO
MGITRRHNAILDRFAKETIRGRPAHRVSRPSWRPSPTIAADVVSNAIRWSRDIYIEHITGVPQFNDDGNANCNQHLPETTDTGARTMPNQDSPARLISWIPRSNLALKLAAGPPEHLKMLFQNHSCPM